MVCAQVGNYVNAESGEAVATTTHAYYWCPDGYCVGKNLKRTGTAEPIKSANIAAASSAKP